MEDPVILVESGAIFEHQAIKDVLANGAQVCPHSKVALPVSNGRAAVTLLPLDGLRQVKPSTIQCRHAALLRWSKAARLRFQRCN